MGWLQDLALGMLLVTFFAVELFSLWWMINGGDLPALKLASWQAKVLYWNGVFVFGSLIAAGALVVMWAVGAMVLGV